MDNDRQDPDELLRKIKREEALAPRGHLKIFFGYAAGVGKTYAMLKAARTAKNKGIDVVAGYVEPHARPETSKLLSGLEILPTQTRMRGSLKLEEFDVDAAIKRKPQLILVDELAHTNAEGMRHKKRFQDVEELLEAGIDVFSTLNVQHLESLNDMVASITNVKVHERIPDEVFDKASQVELVDIEPEDLIQRLNEGKVYKKNQAETAKDNFFTVQNLVALREICLRRSADRVNIISEAKRGTQDDYYTDEHILVCLSSSPTNAKIIRTASRMATAFKASFTALFVETTKFADMTEEDKDRLRKNIRLASQLGANIETVYGDDVALQISEFARLVGVSKIVLGRTSAKRNLIFSKQSLAEKITAISPNLDIHIIPDKNTPAYKPARGIQEKPKIVPKDILKSLLILSAASCIGLLFYSLGFSEANIITVYILGVLITAVITSQRFYCLLSSVVSVLVFNFLFTEPRFSLAAYDSGYPATFLIMLIAAFITGTLAVRIKRHAKQSAETAYRTKVLFDTDRLIASAKDSEKIVSVTCKQLAKLLERTIFFYFADKKQLKDPLIFECEGFNAENCLNEDEKAVAAWVMRNNKHAGATTNTLGNSKCLYLSVRVGAEVYGVIGIAMNQIPLDSFENSIVLSILGECALALKNDESTRQSQQAALLAKNEQLRANLLRSISHDLRTPLTSISGNAGILLQSADNIDAEKKQKLYSDIYDDSLWLINLVENLLSVTRLEDGTLRLRSTAELMEEVITESLKHIDHRQQSRKINVVFGEEFILAKMDARLIMQVIINLVDNAIKYTPEDSVITIETIANNGIVYVSVKDNGDGISAEAKERVFDMFYTAECKIADSRRSMGLGLALCKSIVNAHAGEISVSDNSPKGTVFTFTLPQEEVNINE